MAVRKRHSLLLFTLFLCAVLIALGFIFIYSSSSVYALERCGSSAYYIKRQFFGFCLGLCGLFFGATFPLEYIKKLSPLFFIGTLGLTVLTMFNGITIHGSQRWLSLAGISFQPSELLKIAFLLYSAYFFAKKGNKIAHFYYSFVPYMCILAITSSLLLLQPDFGQAVVLTATGLLLFFVAGCTVTHLISLFLPLILLLGLLIIMKPYRLKRVVTFLDPWRDPQGAGFQIIQSLIALGSGSWYGLGIGNSKQKFFYLPMQHTDFIFSIIAEETGFLGSVILIFVYILLLYCGIKLALRIRDQSDQFSFYLTLGFFFIITIQAFINLSVAVGLLPTKGIGLPFVSYGISSLFSNMCLLGVVINASLRSKTPIEWREI